MLNLGKTCYTTHGPGDQEQLLVAAVFKSRMMADYRAYIVGKDGHFESFEVVQADSDEQALKVAEKLVDGHDVELWHLARKVAVLKYKS